MAGALAERAFVEKLENAGFTAVEVGHRLPFGVDDVSLYPLFTPELLALMRALIAPERQGQVATGVIAQAKKPAGAIS